MITQTASNLINFRDLDVGNGECIWACDTPLAYYSMMIALLACTTVPVILSSVLPLILCASSIFIFTIMWSLFPVGYDCHCFYLHYERESSCDMQCHNKDFCLHLLFFFQLKYCAHDTNKTIKVWRETFAFLISCNVQHE